MKLKKIILYYPSFERGGVENILINISNFFLKKKVKLDIVTSQKIIKKNNNLKYYLIEKKNKRIITSLLSISVFLKTLVINYKDRGKTCILSLQSNTIAILLGKILGYRVAIRNSEYPLGSLLTFDDNIFKTFLIFFQKIFFYNFADLIISNSQGSRDTIRKFIINKKKVIYIYNPYLKKVFKENTKYRKNIILFVGRFVEQKGIKYLLDAFSMFEKKKRNFELWMVGSGPEIKRIKDFKSEKNLTNKIKLFNWQNDLSKFYKNAKYFVLPSIYEGLGNVVIEALNYSRICIVSNCKHGPSEILNYGKGGFIFQSKSSIDLYRKLMKIDENYDKAKKKVEFGRTGLNRFLINKQSLKYLIALKNLK